MHLAIVDDRGDVFVEYDEQVFKKLIKKYYEEYGDLDRAFDEVVIQLRNLTLRK